MKIYWINLVVIIVILVISIEAINPKIVKINSGRIKRHLNYQSSSFESNSDESNERRSSEYSRWGNGNGDSESNQETRNLNNGLTNWFWGRR